MINRKSGVLAIFLLAWTLVNFLVRAAEVIASAPVAGAIYLEPRVITGTIYEKEDLKKVLFTFRRTATNSGSSIIVMREYTLTNGTLAAKERVVYRAGKLSSYQFEDLQNQTVASAMVQVDSHNGDRFVFDFKQGTTHKNDSEEYEKTALVNDMVVPFILEHWDTLMQGTTVKCRLITVARAETIGFKFTKESETTRQGKAVVRIRMEPTSIIVSQFVETLYFTLEKEGAHHVLQYTGRTSPAIFRKGKWEDLDAVTVFDWK